MARVAFAVFAACFGQALVADSPGAAEAPRLVIFGDSLTAGYNLPETDSFRAELSRSLAGQGVKAEVIAASVSGSTSSEGVDRVNWILREPTDFVFLALGANDFLRGIQPAETRANLNAIIRQFSDAGANVILAGLYAPRNLGPEYRIEFEAIFPDLAQTHSLPFLPFLLEGVALVPELNLPDGLHPNPEGVRTMVRHALPVIEQALRNP